MTKEFILKVLISNSRVDVEVTKYYGEEGYKLPKGKEGVMLSNWNILFDNYPNLSQYISDHWEIERSDEWVIDYKRGKAYRISPDSNSWICQVMYSERTGELLTPDTPIECWVEELDNNFKRAAHPSLNLEEQGYRVLEEEEFESGWYNRNGDPEEIYNKLKETYSHIIFRVTDTSQFRVNFEVLVK